MVGARGIEPLTPSMSRKCSTAELSAQSGLVPKDFARSRQLGDAGTRHVQIRNCGDVLTQIWHKLTCASGHCPRFGTARHPLDIVNLDGTTCPEVDWRLRAPHPRGWRAVAGHELLGRCAWRWPPWCRKPNLFGLRAGALRLDNRFDAPAQYVTGSVAPVVPRCDHCGPSRRRARSAHTSALAVRSAAAPADSRSDYQRRR
jgi:hypothetical protein